MLLIQEITLTWGKSERGADGDRMRRQFSMAYPFDRDRIAGEITVHHVSLIQERNRVLHAAQAAQKSMEKYLQKLEVPQEKIEKETAQRIRWMKEQEYQSYHSQSELNLTNLSADYLDDKWEITFFYDERRSGMPVRRGHNKDFENPESPLYGKDLLNERAFVLTPGQYGRICWNERRTDADTGEWYYQLHVYNLLWMTGQHLADDVLVERRPDVVYRQMARVY